MADLNSLAADIKGLALEDAQALWLELQGDFSHLVEVAKSDILGSTPQTSGDPVSPPTGPKP